MTTTIEPPKEALRLALEDVDAAQQQVKKRAEELSRAQARANALDGFPAAAQLEADNAEARWRVLDETAKLAAAEEKELSDQHDRLQDKLTDAEAELARADEIDRAVKKARTALEKAASSAERWAARAGEAVGALEETAKGLETAANTAGKENQRDLSRAERSVGEQHSKLDRETGTLRRDLAAVNRDLQAVKDITGPAELRERVKELKGELASVTAKQKAKHPTVSDADLRKAKSERDNAQLVLQEAPDAQRAAQTDLGARQAELASAQTGLTNALDGLDKVQQEFVQAIRVSAPDANGWAMGRAVLKPGMEIPDGYRLGWTAGGAHVELEDKQGLRVRIDTAALPPGDTDVMARLEHVPAAP